MRDMFDEFLEELQRRQRGEKTRDPDAPDERGDADDANSGDADDAKSGDEQPAEEGGTDTIGEDEADAPGRGTPEEDAEPEPGDREPTSIGGSGRSGRGGGRGGRRGRGGPNDGATFRDRFGRAGRRILLVVAIVVLVLLFTVAGSFLDLWTDAIWFRSVGFDAVFWTRLGAQFVLFLLGFGVAAVVLLGNLWIAGRLSPPPDPSGRGSIAAFLERFTETGGDDQRPGRGPDRPTGFGGRRGPRSPFDPFDGGFGGSGNRGGSVATTFEIEDLPDLTPVGRWLLIGLAILLSFGVGAALGARWETILLWQHQTTFGTDPASPVTDPVFGRDIGFFLFQLPFLRLAQGAINGLLLASLVLVLGRYALGALRGSLVFGTPIRLHLAVLGGLYLLSVAAGYQLDKYELVYSDQGVASGVAYTDFHARFFAFDALTVIAALAAAFLIGGAFTRLIWPLGLAVGAWLLASVVLGGIYPQFVQRFTVEPNKFAEEQPYIVNNIAMTRLAFGLNAWGTNDYRG